MADCYSFNEYRPKMARHTLKILQLRLQDFITVSDHIKTLYTKGLKRLS